MISATQFLPLLRVSVLLMMVSASAVQAAENLNIVLVAGEVKQVDREGHHDSRGGCLLLRNLLEQNTGVKTRAAENGWPADESIFNGAAAMGE